MKLTHNEWMHVPMEQVTEMVRDMFGAQCRVERTELGLVPGGDTLDKVSKVDYLLTGRTTQRGMAVRAQVRHQDFGTITLRDSERRHLHHAQPGDLRPYYMAHFYEGGTVSHVIVLDALIQQEKAGDIAPRFMDRSAEGHNSFWIYYVNDMSADAYIGRWPDVSYRFAFPNGGGAA